MKKAWNFGSLLALNCPACGANTFTAGFYKTSKACGRCGENFEPESGFFAGAIYPMYAMGVFIGATVGGIAALAGAGPGVMFIAAAIAILACSPWIFWYARLGFLYTNHRFFKENA
jgi:uncharacterized protein (DUF983 family)